MCRKTRFALLFCATALAAARPLVGEVIRTLRVEVPDAARSAFAVENLAGTMRVSAGAGDDAAVVATVHAENEALANSVRLEQASGSAGVATVHVQYPESLRTLRYPNSSKNPDWFLDLLSVSEEHSYQGRKFSLSRSHGQLLYVDLEVRLPVRVVSGTFRNLVGRIEGENLEGKLRFEVESADLKLGRLRGDIVLHGTSGDTTASEIAGTWSSEFTSGDCSMRGFRGESLSFHTTSGDVEAREIESSRLRIQTTSGDSEIRDADIAEVEVQATSGDVGLDERGARLTRLRAEATSGDVVLRLPRDASFQATARATSGDIRVRYDDVTFLRHDQEPATYRRGSGGAQIQVKTTSGNLTIQPR